jgi:hypothetical protein
MAFYEEDAGGGGGRFLRINNKLGSLVMKSDVEVELDSEGNPTNTPAGHELFETKNPQTDADVKYYVKRLKGGVSGTILGLQRVEIPASKLFGYNLHLEDEDGRFSIYFADDRATTQRLLKVYENIDLDQEVHIKVFKDDDGYAAIAFSQNGKNVAQKWNGGKEGNLPQPKKSKGKWDYSPIDEFLYENAMKNIVPNYVEPVKEEKADAVAAGSTEPAQAPQADDDDIPF